MSGRILFADGTPPDSLSGKNLFEQAFPDDEVLVLDSGEATVALCELRPPTCLVMGESLSDSTGIGTLKRVRGSRRLPPVPVVFVTEGSGPGRRAEARALGAQICIGREELHPPLLRLAVGTATQLHQLRWALHDAEEKFRTILELSPDPITITRLADGRLVEVNRPFEVFSGYSRQEAIGRRPTELGLWDDPQEHETGMQQLETGKGVREFPATFRTKDGRTRQGKISAAVITLDAEPGVLSFVHLEPPPASASRRTRRPKKPS